jgi:hypothetical protein
VIRRPGPATIFLPPDLEADGAAQDLEPLLLARVDVRGGHEAVRLDERLDHDRLTAGLARRLAEDEALAGDRVFDGVSCVNHVCSPFWVVSRAHSPKALKIGLASA